MPTLVIKPNPSLAVQIDIEDLWFGIAPGNEEIFTESDDIREIAKSRNLPVFLVDDVFGAGNSSLILNDGVSDVPQADALSFLSTILLPKTGAYSVLQADSLGNIFIDLSSGGLVFKVEASPTPTVIGDAVWDSVGSHLVVGDGSGQVTLLDDGSIASGDVVGPFTSLEVQDLTIAGEAQGDLLYRGPTSWVRLPAGVAGQVLKTLGVAANPEWVSPGSLSSRVDNIAVGTPLKGTKNLSYKTVAYSVFPGTLVNTPTNMGAVVRNSKNPGTMSLRIQDITNGLTIVELTGIASVVVEYKDLGAISNLSSGIAIWAVQVRADSGSNNKAQCGSITVVY